MKDSVFFWLLCELKFEFIDPKSTCVETIEWQHLRWLPIKALDQEIFESSGLLKLQGYKCLHWWAIIWANTSIDLIHWLWATVAERKSV